MKGHPLHYLPQELAWIEARKDMPRRDLWAMFCARWSRDDVSLMALKSLCKRRGWYTGRTGQFAPGQAPSNKGKTMPFNANSAATRFQKGGLPHNTRGAGHESVASKDGYVWMIVAETNPHTGAATRRVMKHKRLWELINGPVPAGHALKSRDGNRLNTDPSNWEAIPRALLPRLNGRHGRGYDAAEPEVKPVLMTITRLEHQARTARRKAPHG